VWVLSGGRKKVSGRGEEEGFRGVGRRLPGGRKRASGRGGRGLPGGEEEGFPLNGTYNGSLNF
jgi:hypothetical protein